MNFDDHFRPQRLFRVLTLIACAAVCGVPVSLQAQDSPAAETESTPQRATGTESKTLSTPDLIDRLMSGTAYVHCPKVSTGTCWLADRERRLVVTNQHVVNKAKTIQVYFPVKKEGEWVTDLTHYLRFVKPSNARVILSDVKSDLALLQLDRVPEGFRAFELAKRSPRQGSQLHTIAGKPLGSETMWVYTFGRVRQVGRGRTALGHFTRIVQAQMEFNKGNSGGPIVNDSGQLVAVVEGYRKRAANGANFAEVRNVSMGIDVRQVKLFLKAGLPLVDPQSAEAFAERGRRHSNEGRYNQAIKDFSSAIRLDKNHAAAYAGRGWAFHMKGDSQTAIGDYDEAIKIDAAFERGHYGRGIVNRKLGNTKEAIGDFSNAIRINPESHRSYNQRGITYFRGRRYKSAYNDFTRAAKLKPTDAQLHANRALAAERGRNYSVAIQAYNESLRLNPRSPGNINHLGICHYRSKDYAKAAQAFKLAIKLSPNRAIYYVNLGDSLHHLGQDETAISAFSTALRIRKSYMAYYSRGLSFATLKKYAEAIADQTDSIRLNPKFAPAYYQRALAYRAAGKETKSVADLQKAGKLDPKSYGRFTSTPETTPTKAPAAAKNSVVGTWVCIGKINGVDVRIVSTMTAAGTYRTTATYQKPDAAPMTETESGTYTVNGNQMTIKPKDDEPATRRFGFKNGQLWLNMQEHKLTLYFTKQT